MAKKKKIELKDLGVEELRLKEKEVREDIFRLRMKRAASALDDKMAIRNGRRTLARVLTALAGKAK